MNRRRDEGAVLPLVLILMVVGAFVVVPLLGYAVVVLKSNTVLSERTKDAEAAKGGLRVALNDPLDVFQNCDGGGHPINGGADPVINGTTVGLSCSELEEVGPLTAQGYDVPMNLVALQLGAQVPVELSGTRPVTDPVPPYPDDGPGWWQDATWTAREWATLLEDEIFLPDLPRYPATNRSSAPFSMPGGFNCQVYLPGRYTAPVDLTGNVYFASGVYYFEEPVTVLDGADVVVGYGLADFFDIGSECADDIQVAANIESPPPTFDINGGGATWVFGENGRFVIDDQAASGDIRVRFNQRYAAEDRGGRVSIMTVNGDDTANADHVVTNVNLVPRSFIRDGENSAALTGSSYVPSSSEFTDKARVPAQVPAANANPLYDDAAGRGAIMFTWDEVAGQDAGGAWLGEQDGDGNWVVAPYDLQLRVNSPVGPWSSVCPPEELVVTPPGDPADGNELSCLIADLNPGTQYRVRIRAVNEVGAGPWRGSNATPEVTSPSVRRPGPPSNVVAVAGQDDDSAVVSWDLPDNGGAPVTGYDVTATRVYIEPPPNLAPVVTGSASVTVSPGSPTSVGVPVFDPNGDELSLMIDASALEAAGGSATVVDPVGAPLDVLVDAGTAPDGTYPISYTVTDLDGPTEPGTIDVNVVAVAGPNQDPVAPTVVFPAEIGVETVVRVPAYDPDGDPLTLDVDTAALDVADWTVSYDPSALAVSVTTTAPDGTYSIPYTVTDPGGLTAPGTIDVLVARSYEAVGGCEVRAGPLLPVDQTCQIAGLSDLLPVDGTETNLGYRFDVVATNSVGVSDVGASAEPYLLAFDGGGDPLDPAPVRMVEPWVPTPIIDIDASGPRSVIVDVPGYVSVPMGRISVTNPAGDDIQIRGGVAAGTFSVDDSRAVSGVADTVPIGFKNDFVLQRQIRIVATARNMRATAVVQINENGADYAVNSWVVQ